MADLEKAVATQLANIEKRSGKTLAELSAIIHNSGLSKHSELVAMLKTSLGMGHGDANTLVLTVRKAQEQAAGTDTGEDADPLDVLYVGAKAALRPIHEHLLQELNKLGPFEAAPKKTYVSYRRKKQFLMIGPATASKVEVGFNMKGVEGGERLQALPAGQMCNYKLRLGSVDEVDQELLEWIRTAYQSAG